MTIAICDDDAAQVGALKKLLLERDSRTVILEYGSAEQFLFGYADRPCDLLLLDIEMGGMNGMELAKSLRAKGDMLPIIFITGYADYIGDGYDVEALHYLLKPLDSRKLFAVLDRCESRRPANRVIFECGGESVCVNADDIEYLEAFGKKTQVTLGSGKELLCSCGLSAAAGRLSEGFVQCHRSYVVNIAHIHSISGTEVTLGSGRRIPLSRRLSDSVNRAFIGYYKERTI